MCESADRGRCLEQIADWVAETAAYADLPRLNGSTIHEWPVTEKEVVKASPGRFRTHAFPCTRITSSGSTGTPMPCYRTLTENQGNAAAVAEAWETLLGDIERIVSVIDHNTAAAGQLLEAVSLLRGWTLSRGYPYRIGGARMDLLADAFVEFCPEVVMATPSGLVDIEEGWRSHDVFDEAKRSVTSLLMIGAPATRGMRARLARSWKAAALIASYGSTEVGTIACGCRYGQLHVLEGRHYLELRQDGDVRPLEFGSPGELIVTPLYSEAMQFVRYATGDRVSVIACECGTDGRAIAVAGTRRRLCPHSRGAGGP